MRKRCRSDKFSDEEYDCEKNGDRLGDDISYEMKKMMSKRRFTLGYEYDEGAFEGALGC